MLHDILYSMAGQGRATGPLHSHSIGGLLLLLRGTGGGGGCGCEGGPVARVSQQPLASTRAGEDRFAEETQVQAQRGGRVVVAGDRIGHEPRVHVAVAHRHLRAPHRSRISTSRIQFTCTEQRKTRGQMGNININIRWG